MAARRPAPAASWRRIVLGSDPVRRAIYIVGLQPALWNFYLGVMDQLGAAAWQRLHRLVYVAAAAAAVHFVMVVKSWPAEPLIYAGLVAALLLFRLVARLQKRARPARALPPEPVSA